MQANIALLYGLVNLRGWRQAEEGKGVKNMVTEGDSTLTSTQCNE